MLDALLKLLPDHLEENVPTDARFAMEQLRELKISSNKKQIKTYLGSAGLIKKLLGALGSEMTEDATRMIDSMILGHAKNAEVAPSPRCLTPIGKALHANRQLPVACADCTQSRRPQIADGRAGAARRSGKRPPLGDARLCGWT